MKNTKIISKLLVMGTLTMTFLTACGGGEHTHSYGSLIQEVSATCVDNGVMAHYECSECHKKFIKEGETYIEKNETELVIGALGHSYGEEIAEIPATCTEDGVMAHYECSRCSKEFIKEGETYIEKTAAELVIHTSGHDYGVLIPEKAATCEEEGYLAHYECSVCHNIFVKEGNEYIQKSYADITIKKSHSYGELIPQKEPSCEEEGYLAHYECSICHHLFIKEGDVFIEVTAEDIAIPESHFYGSLIPEVPATCVEDGVMAHYECSKCHKLFIKDGDSYIEKTAAELVIKAGHTYQSVSEVPATCTEDGVMAHYECSECHKIFIKNSEEYTEVTADELVLPALGHEYGSLIPEVPASCTEDGVKAHYQCSRCERLFDSDQNEVEFDDLVIGSLGHDFEWVVYSHTSHIEKCSRCEEAGEIEEHIFVDGVCTECGYEKANITACGKYAYVDLASTDKELDISDLSDYFDNEWTITNYETGETVTDFSDLSAGIHDFTAIKNGASKSYTFRVLAATRLIKTEADLAYIRSADGTTPVGEGGYFVLRNNVYLTGTYSVTSYGWNANSGFKGTFDGANHYLEHMVVGLGGLFGTLCGTVKNVEFRNFLISGGWGQCALAYNSYWAALDNVKISLSDNWSATRDPYGMIFGNQVQNITIKNCEFDFASDVSAFYEVSGEGTMKFGYAISKSATFANAIENTTIKLNSAFHNICGDNDVSTLPVSQPGLTVVVE